MVEMVIVPAIVIGVIAGIVDLIFMIKDESGSAKTVISHGMGAFVPILIFSFFSMNLGMLTGLAQVQGTILANDIVMRVALVLVLAVITFSKSKVFKGARGAGTHESFLHTIIVSVIVAVGPWIYPLIEPYLGWLPGSSLK
jgi:hypothetical protein